MNKKLSKNFSQALIALLLVAQQAQAETVGASESKGINLTIYNQNFALVKDVREVELKEGLNYLRFEDVAAKIDPTSVSFQSLTSPDAVTVKEQNYQYDLLDPESILAKSIGKNVKFVQVLPAGQIRELSGVLLNAPQATVVDSNGQAATSSHGLVVKTESGLVLNPIGQIELSELPAGLISKPSLFWKLECKKPGKHKSEIAYQTGDMNWKCDYIVIVNDNDTKADINSWVTLDNRSGASYKNSALKLIAGEVHRVVQPARATFAQSNEVGMMGEPAFQEQSFAEYHLYSLNGKTDVNNNETKQLSLFKATDVPAKMRFIFESAPGYVGAYQGGQPRQNAKVKVKLEIENCEANHLGMPLPAGKLRVYKRDKEGSLQFIGEDEIDHTPCDEKIRMYIGDAFDIAAERKQTNVTAVSNRVRRESYEISLRNHKDSAVKVTCLEHAPGSWKILSSSQPYVKTDSQSFEFTTETPAQGQSKISYDIEYRW